MELKLLYADDRVAVLVKPAGMLSTDEPGGVPEALRAALGDAQAVVRSVHRLDRVVGGVMVYARTKRAAADLGAQLREHTFKKEYLAVVRGRPETPEGELRDGLRRDTKARRSEIVPLGTPGSQEAALRYALLAERGGASLLSVRLETGRTHQIRCQLAARGLPILGDGKYGPAGGGGPIALWSRRIVFAHPRTGERLCFTAPPPQEPPWSDFAPELAALN